MFYYVREVIDTMMDFTPTERQRAAAEAYHDTAGLAGLPVPAELGGAGLSVTELAAVLHEAGRNADGSVVTLMTGTLPLARWGDRELLAKRARVTAALRGDARLAGPDLMSGGDVAPGAAAGLGRAAAGLGRAEAGLDRAAASESPAAGKTAETAAGTTVSGVMTGVPYCAESEYVLVAAGDHVAVVDITAPGVTIASTSTSCGEPEATLRLDDAPVRIIHEGAAKDLDRLATLAACCLADGALKAALDLTAEHVAKREQFGKPLAQFQAVAQRIADVAITSRTVHLATLSAAWQLEHDKPGDDIGLAGYWVASTVSRSVMDCHHLHGGIGMDATYPLHTFSSLIADQVRRLGGAEYRLERLACTSI
jgi:alkylation response protein AidB-like acyl-CoA dehydrogenase